MLISAESHYLTELAWSGRCVLNSMPQGFSGFLSIVVAHDLKFLAHFSKNSHRGSYKRLETSETNRTTIY